MNVRKEILEKINTFLFNNNFEADSCSQVPIFFQEYYLRNSFNEDMVDAFVLALLEDEQALLSFLGEDLCCSNEFREYMANLICFQ